MTTSEQKLEGLMKMARKILKESGYLESNQDIEAIISMMKNSPEALDFLRGEK